MSMVCRALVVSGALFFAAPLLAEDNPAVVSPEIHADRSVTFRLRAPFARAVGVHTNWDDNKDHALTKDESGVWSATLGPLPPQIYTYSFQLDGLALADPANPTVVSRPAWGHVSLVEVPGATPAAWTTRHVPHGTVSALTYVRAGGDRRVLIYTPPGYEEGHRRYPVLYLLHGYSGNENDWVEAGPAHVIADNLLADGKTVPAIMVMPDAHVLPPAPEFDDRKNFQEFQADLLERVIPLVERRFRVKPGAAQRALAGLSMGGSFSLAIGVKHPDRFAWIADMSGGVAPEAISGIEAKNLNARLRLLWLGCGRSDEGAAALRGVALDLEKKGIRRVWRETEGAHNWLVWREYLAELLPQLFRNDAGRP